MKKMWLTTLAIGAFAVPVGVVSAQAGDDIVDDTATTQECDGDQIRQQAQLRDGSGEQARVQRRAHQGEAVGELVRDRQQVRTEDCDGCDGEQLRAHDHDHDQSGGQTRQGGRGN